jgi:ferredoxin
MTAGTVFSGHVVQLAVHFDAPADRTVLQSMEAALIAWPSSCRNGTCRTCICQLSSGSVRYAIGWPGLSADEKAEGCILPCVAYPTGDLVL